MGSWSKAQNNFRLTLRRRSQGSHWLRQAPYRSTAHSQRCPVKSSNEEDQCLHFECGWTHGGIEWERADQKGEWAQITISCLTELVAVSQKSSKGKALGPIENPDGLDKLRRLQSEQTEYMELLLEHHKHESCWKINNVCYLITHNKARMWVIWWVITSSESFWYITDITSSSSGQ